MPSPKGHSLLPLRRSTVSKSSSIGLPTPVTQDSSDTRSYHTPVDGAHDAWAVGITEAPAHSCDDSAGFMSNNPFAFMQDLNFDMDQFLDMGVWGSDSYEGLGFGDGAMQF